MSSKDESSTRAEETETKVEVGEDSALDWPEGEGGDVEAPTIELPPFDDESLFDSWRSEEFDRLEVTPPPRSRLFTLPLLLGASLFFFFFSKGPVEAYINWKSQPVQDCGSPERWREEPSSQPTLTPGMRCRLEGTIANLNVYILGQPEEPDAFKAIDRLKGLNYLSRLNGAYEEKKIFALHPADDQRLEDFKLRERSLFGARLTLEGTVVDPSAPGPYLTLERDLRDRFQLDPSQQLLLIDASDRFIRYRWAFIAFALSCLIALVALTRLGLFLRGMRGEK